MNEVEYWKQEYSKMLKENNQLWENLGRITAMCGTPDAADGCRNILSLIRSISPKNNASEAKKV